MFAIVNFLINIKQSHRLFFLQVQTVQFVDGFSYLGELLSYTKEKFNVEEKKLPPKKKKIIAKEKKSVSKKKEHVTERKHNKLCYRLIKVERIHCICYTIQTVEKKKKRKKNRKWIVIDSSFDV